jgi:hypothetical protein
MGSRILHDINDWRALNPWLAENVAGFVRLADRCSPVTHSNVSSFSSHVMTSVNAKAFPLGAKFLLSDT